MGRLVRGDDGTEWIPAFAGMTKKETGMTKDEGCEASSVGGDSPQENQKMEHIFIKAFSIPESWVYV